MLFYKLFLLFFVFILSSCSKEEKKQQLKLCNHVKDLSQQAIIAAKKITLSCDINGNIQLQGIDKKDEFSQQYAPIIGESIKSSLLMESKKAFVKSEKKDDNTIIMGKNTDTVGQMQFNIRSIKLTRDKNNNNFRYGGDVNNIYGKAGDADYTGNEKLGVCFFLDWTPYSSENKGSCFNECVMVDLSGSDAVEVKQMVLQSNDIIKNTYEVDASTVNDNNIKFDKEKQNYIFFINKNDDHKIIYSDITVVEQVTAMAFCGFSVNIDKKGKDEEEKLTNNYIIRIESTEFAKTLKEGLIPMVNTNDLSINCNIDDQGASILVNGKLQNTTTLTNVVKNLFLHTLLNGKSIGQIAEKCKDKSIIPFSVFARRIKIDLDAKEENLSEDIEDNIKRELSVPNGVDPYLAKLREGDRGGNDMGDMGGLEEMMKGLGGGDGKPNMDALKNLMGGGAKLNASGILNSSVFFKSGKIKHNSSCISYATLSSCIANGLYSASFYKTNNGFLTSMSSIFKLYNSIFFKCSYSVFPNFKIAKESDTYFIDMPTLSVSSFNIFAKKTFYRMCFSCLFGINFYKNSNYIKYKNDFTQFRKNINKEILAMCSATFLLTPKIITGLSLFIAGKSKTASFVLCKV